MVPKEVTSAARAAAVMVRVHGPDPKGRKMRNHAFHHSEFGDTTLSASGLLLPAGVSANETSKSNSAVLTCASIVEPFLQKSLPGGPKDTVKRPHTLIAGAEVDVLIENVDQRSRKNYMGGGADGHNHTPYAWLPAKLVDLVDIPLAGSALQALLNAHGGSIDGSWEVGWALAHGDTSRSQASSSLSYKGNDPTVLPKSGGWDTIVSIQNFGNDLASATTRMAVLSLDFELTEITPGLVLANSPKKGNFLLVIGSPFGALSPLHFFNSLVVGIVANCWPPTSPQASLLMADLRCLPGMEGAPVFNGDGAFVGILARPLRQRGGGAEVQLVITWNAIVPALQEIGIDLEAEPVKKLPAVHTRGFIEATHRPNVDHPDRIDGVQQSNFSPNITEALGSVVLVTVGDGAWASGVIVNKRGLILTNAHLLEPWRFGKAQLSQAQGERELSAVANGTQTGGQIRNSTLVSSAHEIDGLKVFNNLVDPIDLPFPVRELELHRAVKVDGIITGVASNEAVVQPSLEINYRSYRKIRVRLEHPLPRSWYNARVVYISRGPLDIALLQLDSVPLGLQPIKPEEECPSPGSTAVVIGHGLFGPRSGNDAFLAVKNASHVSSFVFVCLILGRWAELCPSLSAGVVSRVVKAGVTCQGGHSESEELPAMLETTAAVHPGGSGGAVVNEQGLLIGLVTSNARHSGGTVIPHLNFSIPYAALKPIFLYAAGDMNDSSLLAALGKPNEQLAAVWALVPPTPPRPAKVMPFLPKVDSTDNQKTALKGSRFAKFLSEKNVDLPNQSPSMQAKDHQVSRKWLVESIPSKDFIPGQVLHSRL